MSGWSSNRKQVSLSSFGPVVDDPDVPEPEEHLMDSIGRMDTEGGGSEEAATPRATRFGWLKDRKAKWTVAILILVGIIIAVVMVTTGKDKGGTPPTSNIKDDKTSVGGGAPSTSAAAPTAVSSPNASPAYATPSVGSPTMLSSPSALMSPTAGYPAQSPVVSPTLGDQTGLVLQQFGKVFGYTPNSGARSIASAVSNDGTTVALMVQPVPDDPSLRVRVYRYHDQGGLTQLGEDILGTGDTSIVGVGQSLSFSEDGSCLAIGFFNEKCDLGDKCGTVFVACFDDNTWKPVGKEIIGDQANMMLGWSIAISKDGLTLAAGAPYGSGSETNVDVGQVKVLRFVSGEGWKALGTVLQGDGLRDQFGCSVALSADGNILAVGALQGEEGKNGYVKVLQYDEDTGGFVQLASTILGDGSVDQFGYSVALSYDGSTLAIGGIQGSGDLTGMVCVFEYRDLAWIKVKNDILSGIKQDLFGYSVDINADGDRVLVGSPGLESMAGAAYLYELGTNGWEQHGEVIYSKYEKEELGRSVSLSGSGIVIAAGGIYGDYMFGDANPLGAASPAASPNASPVAAPGGFLLIGDVVGYKDGYISIASTISGDGGTAAVVNQNEASQVKVCVFRNGSDGVWTKLGSDIAGTGNVDAVGKSVALSADGNTIAVGFFGEGCNGGELCGHLRVYSYDTNDWIQIGQDIVGAKPNGFLGWSIALDHSGTTLAAGAPISHGDDGVEHPGKLRVFRLEMNTWRQLGPDLEGDGEWDHLGSSVSLSSDGSIVASGAVQGLPENLGYVKVYRYDASTDSYSQIGNNIVGDIRTDKFGDAVSLSGDGDMIAIGAIKGGNKETARAASDSSFGIVCVFRYENSNWVKAGNEIQSKGTEGLFGYSVSMNNAGNKLIVGAPETDKKAGSVSVYYFDGSSWMQFGDTIYSVAVEGPVRTFLGRSTAISHSGNVVAGGGRAGLQVYSIDSGFIQQTSSEFDEGAPSAPSSFLGASPTIATEEESPNAAPVTVAEDKPIALSSDQILTPVGERIGNDGKEGLISFASALSGDGSTVAVAWRSDPAQVQVCVYRYDSTGTWTKIGDDITGEGSLDAVGKSLALAFDGNTIAVGFYNEGCELGENCGHLRIFSFDGGSWVQLGQDIVGEKTYGFLGWSVAISKDASIVAVGAAISHGETVNHAGKVRVFRLEGVWKQIGADLEGDGEWDHLGSSVALSADGEILASGAVQGMEGNNGYVKVFQYDQSTDSYSQLGSDILGDERTDQFGEAVSLSDDGYTLAVGATKASNEEKGTPSFGLACAFVYTESGWSKLGNDIESGTTDDLFGFSVAVNADGNRMIVGAPDCNSHLGCVSIYDLDVDSWEQLGATILPDSSHKLEGEIGRSVSIASSGKVFAVGGKEGTQVYETTLEPFETPSAFSSPAGSPTINMALDKGVETPSAPAGAPSATGEENAMTPTAGDTQGGAEGAALSGDLKTQSAPAGAPSAAVGENVMMPTVDDTLGEAEGVPLAPAGMPSAPAGAPAASPAGDANAAPVTSNAAVVAAATPKEEGLEVSSELSPAGSPAASPALAPSAI